jgi:hypothetical protein
MPVTDEIAEALGDDVWLVPEPRRRRGMAALPLCPSCASVLDAPRATACSGPEDRWCRVCLRWRDPRHPIGGRPIDDAEHPLLRPTGG